MHHRVSALLTAALVILATVALAVILTGCGGTTSAPSGNNSGGQGIIVPAATSTPMAVVVSNTATPMPPIATATPVPTIGIEIACLTAEMNKPGSDTANNIAYLASLGKQYPNVKFVKAHWDTIGHLNEALGISLQPQDLPAVYVYLPNGKTLSWGGVNVSFLQENVPPAIAPYLQQPQ